MASPLIVLQTEMPPSQPDSSSSPPSLDDLRREIDRIDDALHDLLLQRTAIGEQIGAAKGRSGEVTLRPGREAEIIRRLMARHRGSFPRLALIRIWREIISAMVGLQGPFTVAVTASETGGGFLELARNHYGTTVPVLALRTPGQVVGAVADGGATVGVVPVPGREEAEGGARPDAWWIGLMSDATGLPRIISRLPFASETSATGSGIEALAIAKMAGDPTGFDRSWLGIETEPDLSRARFKTLLAAAGFEPSLFASTWRGEGRWLHLVEVIGHTSPDDGRIPRLTTKNSQILRTVVLGGHAVPLSADVLGE